MPADDSDSGKTAVAAEPFIFGSPRGPSASRPPNDGAGANSNPPANANNNETVRQAYEKGFAEGEARTRANYESGLANLRGEVSGALQQFSRQRDAYFERVETEVVQLALSIARKILHREAQIDPLLLAGIVRVALDTLSQGTHARLRTSPDEIALWRDYFASTGGSVQAELIGDASLEPGRCVLETDLGSTNISLETHLKEIEQGFLDLLKHRPREKE
jgi:flagellar assembly protein FliH